MTDVAEAPLATVGLPKEVVFKCKFNYRARGGLELYVLLFDKSAEAIVGGLWCEPIGRSVEVERTFLKTKGRK
jgi:hypothetical protein